jgi:hypothetical protein
MATPNVPNSASAQARPNIFSTPLKAKLEADEATRKRNQRMGMVKLVVSLVVLAIYSVQFFYPQMVEYLNFETKLKGYQDQSAQLEAQKSDLQKTRDLHKAAYDAQFKDQQEVTSTVFPETTDKLGVIRLMENTADYLNTTYPTFDFNSISFQSPVSGPGFTALPFQTSIHTTRANFDRFLEFVKLSGDIDLQSKNHIRLMDISSISLRYLGVDSDGKDLGVDFNVSMKAYSRG